MRKQWSNRTENDGIVKVNVCSVADMYFAGSIQVAVFYFLAEFRSYFWSSIITAACFILGNAWHGLES